VVVSCALACSRGSASAEFNDGIFAAGVCDGAAKLCRAKDVFQRGSMFVFVAVERWCFGWSDDDVPSCHGHHPTHRTAVLQ